MTACMLRPVIVLPCRIALVMGLLQVLPGTLVWGDAPGSPRDQQPAAAPSPLSPQESMAMTHVRAGYRLELVAAEPLVADPVAIDWGPDGRLWVAEMSDYPSGDDAHGGGRIRVLEDRDGDGRYDTSHVVLDGVHFPTGVMAWRAGALVTAAPEIFYVQDAGGHGKAERREVLFQGFHEGNQQLRVNGLRWGLDNWIYCASGSHHGGYGAGTRILSLKTGQHTTLGSRDFRFQPETGALEPLSGPAQFGRNRDDWGNWFGVQNSHPLWYYVLEDRYLRRNPEFAAPDPRFQVLTPANPPVYPASSPEKRFHSFEHAGRFTSACSAMIYRDELLFPRQPGVEHGFTCEPFHNLVQHHVLEEQGTVFRARRDPSETETDFFASEDRWCRPVMVRTGPDGALWVVDMYRYVIEHPEWLPPEGQEELRPYFRFGEGMGRIYRIVPDGRPARPIPRLDRLEPRELVERLASPNGWERDTAQRLLVDSGDKTVVEGLEMLLANSPQPLARLHALGTLAGLEQLSAAALARALQDAHPAIRRLALRLAETPAGADARLRQRALSLVTDPNPKVRLQLASSLGEWPGDEVAGALGRLLREGASDPYLVAAVMSSLTPSSVGGVVQVFFEGTSRSSPSDGFADTASLLLAQALALGAGGPVNAVLTAALQETAAARARDRWVLAACALELIEARPDASWADPRLRAILRKVAAAAREVVSDGQLPAGERSAAVRVLLYEPERREADEQRLVELLRPDQPVELQQAVVDHLARRPTERTAERLLGRWPGCTPQLRRQIVSALMTRPQSTAVLLRQVEAQQVAAGELDLAVRQALLATGPAERRAQARRLFGEDAGGTAGERAREVLQGAPGDPRRGAELFARHCAVCHEAQGERPAVGPTLAAVTDRSPEALLVAILDPNQAVESRYLSYMVVLEDGRMLTGALVAETATSFTLAMADGRQQVVPRRAVAELRGSGKSLMPEGWARELDARDLSDLIAHIRQMR